MRICLFSVYDKPYEEIAKETIFSNFKNYCILQGYSLKFFEISNSESLATAWYKIACAKNVLDQSDYDYVMFVDADCLFLNTLRRIEEFIDPNFFMTCSNEINPNGDKEIISSHMIFKNCEKSKQYLSKVLEYSSDPSYKYRTTHPWEQVPVNEVAIMDEFKGGINRLDPKSLNIPWPHNDPYFLKAYPHCNNFCYKAGDFIAHFSGFPMEERLRLIKMANEVLTGGHITNWRCYVDNGNYVVYFTSLDNFRDVTIKYKDLKSKEDLHVRKFESFQINHFYTNIFQEKPFDIALVECYSQDKLIAKNILECK